MSFRTDPWSGVRLFHILLAFMFASRYLSGSFDFRDVGQNWPVLAQWYYTLRWLPSERRCLIYFVVPAWDCDVTRMCRRVVRVTWLLSNFVTRWSFFGVTANFRLSNVQLVLIWIRRVVRSWRWYRRTSIWGVSRNAIFWMVFVFYCCLCWNRSM